MSSYMWIMYRWCLCFYCTQKSILLYNPCWSFYLINTHPGTHPHPQHQKQKWKAKHNAFNAFDRWFSCTAILFMRMQNKHYSHVDIQHNKPISMACYNFTPHTLKLGPVHRYNGGKSVTFYGGLGCSLWCWSSASKNGHVQSPGLEKKKNIKVEVLARILAGQSQCTDLPT